MNQKDKILLNFLQFDFPITESPYKTIGEKLHLSENKIIERVQKLKGQKIIRRIGAVFESKKLSHKSVLVAARAPKQKIEEITKVISGYHEITHCYLRDNEYNFWFTITAPSIQEIEQIARNLEQEAGIYDLHILPALKKYKIDTRFKL